MASETDNQQRVGSKVAEEEICMYATQLVCLSVLPMTLKAAIELGLFEIMISTADPDAYLSAEEIANRLSTRNPIASSMIDRILCLLTSYSILNFSDSMDSDGRTVRRYGAAPVCKYLTQYKDGASMAAIGLFMQDKVLIESWYYLKDAVMNGGVAFKKAHGIMPFEYFGKEQRMNNLFNEATKGHSSIIMKVILEKYEGFNDINELVDVGGGTGGILQMITKRHPHIKGINFDLPHVISEAPPLPGIIHVAGDMFDSIPAGEAIFMKWILHDWSDELCLRILKNCWKSLSIKGKIIIVENILPHSPEVTLEAQNVYLFDMIMLANNAGGKERTENEFKILALQAGFTEFKALFSYANFWVIEITKK